MTKYRAVRLGASVDRFHVGPWLVEPGLNQVTGRDGVRRMEPRVMELLVYLAERAGTTVSRAELMADVWKGASVVDAVLSRAVSALRTALDDDAQEPRFVQTVPRRGYRLIAEVRPYDPAELLRPAEGAPPDRSSAAAPPPLGGNRPLVVSAVAVSLLLIATAMVARFTVRPPAGRPVETLRSIRSLAVLPLEDLSEDSGRAFFAEGMTDALTSGLAKIRALRVVAAPSARQQAGLGPTVAGTNLGVDAVLRGSILQEAGTVALSLQLVATVDGTILWSESFRRPLREVVELQGEIARQVIREIHLEVTAHDARRFQAAQTIDPEAFERTLEARYHWSRRTPSGLRRSRELFEQALLADHRYAPAWAGLADAYLQMANSLLLAPDQAYAAARSAAERAVALDPDLPEAHTALGLVKLIESWDFSSAEASYRHAIALGPSYANVRQFHAELLSMTGRYDEALEEIEIAHRLDPFSPVIQAVRGVLLFEAGRYEAAVARLREAIAFEPSLRWAYRQLAYALERLGRYQGAADALVELAAVTGESEAALRSRLDADGPAGYYRWSLEQQDPASRVFTSAIQHAEVYAGAGEDDAALAWIDRAFEEKGEFFLHLYRSPAFDGLRHHRRFHDRLVEAGIDPGFSPAIGQPSPNR